MLCISRTWCNPSYKLLAFGLHHLHISIFLALLHYIGLSYAINDDDDDDDDDLHSTPGIVTRNILHGQLRCFTNRLVVSRRAD